jgi:hypothetical protein
MVVLCVTLILQATFSALGIMPYCGLNYFGQPIGPVVQFIGGGLGLFCIVMLIIHGNRPEKPDRRRRRRHNPPLPGQVPEKWPWE